MKVLFEEKVKINEWTTRVIADFIGQNFAQFKNYIEKEYGEDSETANEMIDEIEKELEKVS